MSTITVSTDDLMGEVAELSQKLTELKPGVAAEQVCGKCWYPASEHKNRSVKGCKSKQKRGIEEFTRWLLAQRNHLVEMIKAAKGEQLHDDEIEQLRATVKYQNGELEAAKQKIHRLTATKEVLQQLIRSTNNAFRVFSTGGSVDEMRELFEKADELMADLNMDIKSKSSSSEDDDDDDPGDTEDTGGHWDHSAELTWPTNTNIGPALINAQYPNPSPGTQGATSHHVEDRQQQNDAGNRSPIRKTVTFALHPPSLQNTGGQSVSQSHQSTTTGQSVYDVQNTTRYASNTPGVTPPTRQSSILSNPPPVTPLRPRVPGYKDYPGVVLLHERGGTVCGGTPDGDKVIKGTKLVKTEFCAEDGPLKYLERRRRFCDEISSFFSGEDMYTILSIFRQKAACYYRTLTKMFRVESTYTSFLNFLRVFEHILFPQMDAVALGALQTRVQAEGESVVDYYTDYSDLIYIIGRNESDYIEPFIGGLFYRSLAHTVANRVYEEGQRTLEAIANHASLIETNMGLEKIFRPDERKKAQKKSTNDTDSNSKNVSSITTTTGHHSDYNPQRGNNSRGRSRGTQRGTAPRGGQQQSRGASWTGGSGGWSRYGNSSGGLGNGGGNWARYASPASRGGHHQSRGAAPRSYSAGSNWSRGGGAGWFNASSSGQQQRQNAAPRSASVSAADAGQSDPVWEMYRRKMKERDLRGCGACLAMTHEFTQADYYRLCRRLCPCCGTNLKSQDHFAVDCSKMPDDKWEAIQMCKESDMNGDRPNDAA